MKTHTTAKPPKTTVNTQRSDGWMRHLVRILQFRDPFGVARLKRMNDLEKVMRHWHKEETKALAKSEEALECGNSARSAMWMARCHEARLRCNKDFRRPMIELTGKPDLFDANDRGHPTANG